MTESELQIQVADYIRLRYPDAMFHSDFGSGVKLNARQGAIQKRQNGGQKGWPDIFIAEPKLNGPIIQVKAGLFIELKREGTRLKKKNGEWINNHVARQAEVLERLRFRGYVADFAVGFEESKKIIDKYLEGVL